MRRTLTATSRVNLASRAVDFAHAAFAPQFEDFVRAKLRAGNQDPLVDILVAVKAGNKRNAWFQVTVRVSNRKAGPTVRNYAR